VVDASGARFDVQLKGSGQTPFSRRGDGKSALGPVLREYVVSEAMAALGVPTTRALAAVATGERVFRQEGAVPGGVFTRVAASHLRVGTFEYFRARNDIDALRRLADYAIARHYPHLLGAPQPYAAFLEAVATAQATLIAQWLSLGFIHGVMNTDNTAISGQTIDYGPCAFMDAFHGQRVFSSIDSGGRYAWGNQPDIGFWNVARLADTLVPLLAEDVAAATAIAEAAIAGYGERFDQAVLARFRAKLGVPPDAPREVVEACLGLLESQQVDFTLFFRRLTLVAAGEDRTLLSSMFTDGPALAEWLTHWESLARPADLSAMRAANPIRIPRNHRIEQAIQAAYGGDFQPFHRLVEALLHPFEERAEFAEYEAPPQPAEVVRRTFCGT